MTLTAIAQDKAAGRRFLLLLTAMAVLSAMDRQILAVMIEPVKAEFGLSDLQIGLVSGLGFALSFSLLGVPLGRIADRVERRSLIAWTRGLGGVVAASAAGATGFWSLMASRAGGALSDAGGGPASLSLIADLYPPASRSRAMSVFGVGAAFGAMLALVLGSAMAERWGWRVSMGAVGASVVFLALVLRGCMREPQRAAAPVLAEASGAGAVALVWRDPVARWLMVGAAFTLLCGYSFGAWNFSYLVRTHGMSLSLAGWVSGLAAIGSIAGGLASGALADRLSRTRHEGWQIGVPLCGVALALPTGLAYFALPAGQVVAAALMVALFAFFIAAWVAPCYAALSMVVPPQRRATASAMVMLAGSIVGSGIGPIFTGVLSTWLEPWLHGQSLRVALISTVALMGVSVYAFWRAMRAYPAALRRMQSR